jgi:Zn-dependent oligopeptidase
MDVDATGVVVNAVAATGTFVAAAVALWAALAEQLKSRDEKLTAARLVAIDMSKRLTALSSTVRTAHHTVKTAKELREIYDARTPEGSRLEKDMHFDSRMAKAKGALAQLQNVRSIPISEIQGLVGIADQSAIRVVDINDALHDARTHLASVLQQIHPKQQIRTLGEACDSLEKAARELDRVIATFKHERVLLEKAL